jgi:excisionase family DNA binding protein
MSGSRRRTKEHPPEQLELFPPKGYLTAADVAHLLKVPKSFVYRRTCRGHSDGLPSYRFGGHLRFRPDDIEAWIAQHRREPIIPELTTAIVAARRSARATAAAKVRGRRGRG